MPPKKGKSKRKRSYPVEQILKKRVKDGVVQYFIKWLGYPMEECSWVREENMECKLLIEKFENDQRMRKLPELVRSNKRMHTDEATDQTTVKRPRLDNNLKSCFVQLERINLDINHEKPASSSNVNERETVSECVYGKKTTGTVKKND